MSIETAEAQSSYPIVAQYELGDPDKRGPFGLGKRRANSDIPKIKPHEVLVWRVGTRYIVDPQRLQATDDTVVRASSVSVVSVRPGTEVVVSFPIDSQDSAEFVVKVTFICSVREPDIAVRHGQVNAADALLAYLRAYQDIFSLGLEHPISEINKVRQKMAIQVKAYMTLQPPQIPGIEITSATTQVVTPDTVGKIRDLNTEQLIEMTKQQHILDKRAKMTEAINHDPKAALDLAYADGGMSSQEYAERLHQIEEDRKQLEQAERIAEVTRRQAIEDRDAEWAREDQRNRQKANIELLKVLSESGHLDSYNMDLDDLIRRIQGDARPAVTADEEYEALPESQSSEPEDDRDY